MLYTYTQFLKKHPNTIFYALFNKKNVLSILPPLVYIKTANQLTIRDFHCYEIAIVELDEYENIYLVNNKYFTGKFKKITFIEYNQNLNCEYNHDNQ
jgi:hypothetical protein